MEEMVEVLADQGLSFPDLEVVVASVTSHIYQVRLVAKSQPVEVQSRGWIFAPEAIHD